MVTATFATAFVVPNVASAEVIIVEGCRPGAIELRSGSTVTCIDPNLPDDHGGNGDSDWEEHDDGGGGSGGRVTRPRPNAAELRRRRRCRACASAQRECVAMAMAAGKNCASVSEGAAMRRCDLDQPGGSNSAFTPWGCTIASLSGDRCPAAESPWNASSQWSYFGKFANIRKGAVEQLCLEAWQQNHASGSTTDTNTVRGSYEVKFDVAVGSGGGGLGGDRTFAATYTWDGRHGYVGVCSDVENQLRHACIGAATQCIAQNHCSEEDLQ